MKDLKDSFLSRFYDAIVTIVSKRLFHNKQARSLLCPSHHIKMMIISFGLSALAAVFCLSSHETRLRDRQQLIYFYGLGLLIPLWR
jgi:hypothetical protein